MSARTWIITMFVCCLASSVTAQTGDITFDTSASPQAQEHFLKGVAILHSFGFEDAIEEFQKAQQAEPDFPLAYWGEAMAHNGNPLSSPTRQDLPAARAALRKLGASRAERLAKAKTDREKMWMDAVETLYGAGDKEERDWAYADAMKKLYEKYPEQESKAFYALALLGTVRRAGEDFNQQMRAAALVQELFRENPRHPGAAHYVIHAFDDPLHAPLALYAAERYAEIAPDVEHALHMPSHIFVQLGLWDQVVRSNDRAYKASVSWARNKGLSDTQRDFHALAWMQYGHLQRGELAKARAAVDEIRPIAEREETTTRIRATYANMTARYLIESGDWDRYEIPVDALLSERHPGDVYLLLAAAMRALEEEDLATASKIEARLGTLATEPTDGLKSALQGQVTLEDLQRSASVTHHEVQGLVRLAQGKNDEALHHMELAVDAESEMHPAYGPPEPLVPPQELYGYVAMKTHHDDQAAKAFERMLVRMPNRTQSLLGAARIADALGERDLAKERYGQLAEIWSESEPRPELEEATSYQ